MDSSVWTADAKVSGDLISLPAGEIKLAIGGHFRDEAFEDVVVESTSDAPGTIRSEFDRDVYAFFGEVFVPVIGENNAIPGIQRLELNIAGRFEDYSDFGSTADPKVGVLWSPVESLRVRGSYSTSFNPPPIGRVGSNDFVAQLASTSLINLIFGLTPGDPSIANVPVLTVFGTSRDLEPEESRAFTGGLDFDKQWGRHSINFSATYFDIDFDGRLGDTPIPGNAVAFDAPNIAFNNPELFPDGAVIFSPSQSEIDQLLGSLVDLVAFPGLDPLDTEIINSVTVVDNLSRSVVRGFDFDIAYTLEADVGNFVLGLDGTFLKDFQQQAAATTPLVEQIDTLYNPVGLKFRTRAGYANDQLAANIFVNYTDGYQVDNSVDALKIDPWTTVDLSLAYNTGDNIGGSVLDNVMLRLSVINLFDENPSAAPSNPVSFIFGYDPTNASPRNRFIAFEVAKAF